MRELTVAEQRYQAVLAVISDGLSISQVAQKVGVSRQTLHSWLARYEADGLEGLADRSHRPESCPHQMPAHVEAALLELRPPKHLELLETECLGMIRTSGTGLKKHFAQLVDSPGYSSSRWPSGQSS
jgi:transposase